MVVTGTIGSIIHTLNQLRLWKMVGHEGWGREWFRYKRGCAARLGVWHELSRDWDEIPLVPGLVGVGWHEWKRLMLQFTVRRRVGDSMQCVQRRVWGGIFKPVWAMAISKHTIHSGGSESPYSALIPCLLYTSPSPRDS
eukprot:TRINITY_DN3417_c0_g1_i8.p3 TRINITY_DN3417_c0_g1~~TRINITY_DN3417_c0_g1_i8.p3  ORF type:complete len:139 (+),score=14.10 TRINITY_DN3417_c0_g1_i8:569-985(+)